MERKKHKLNRRLGKTSRTIGLTLALFTGFFTQALYSQTTAIQYLSGKGYDDAVEWEFFCTEGRNSGKWTTIQVPSCWELQGFGTYQYGISFYGKANPPGIASEQGKYKYRFQLPAEWEGRTIRIVFDGVMTDCEARINERVCVKQHQGAFYRFKSDITDRVFFGNRENLLEVTVSKESSNPSVNLAERRADYWNFGGIFRPVFIEALPAQFIDRTAINAEAGGSFRAGVFLGAATATNTKIQIEWKDAAGKPVGKKQEFPLSAGSDRITIHSQLDNIKNWTPETPHLYSATFSLLAGNKILHTINERFGFRTIEVHSGDGLYINDQKVNIRGVNRHSFRPETGRTLNKQANYDDVKLMKAMNMNAVRLSHYPPDPDFLDACDELGLYVMDELGGWHGKYDSNAGKKLVHEMVVRDFNHPSVIWWSNGNEGGHNFDLDKEFELLDPQKRPVLHPQKNFGGFETMHYRSYGESLEYMRLPEIYMPTEFLHGLYDGGHGAGLWDYWEMMRNHPRCIGGFLWALADEGVVRVDQNGKIDNQGNYGADGIVGPHHEKEGSFYTVKQIWSPLQIMNTILPEDFDGTLQIENRYDFTNLKDCRLVWTLKNFDNQQEKIIQSRELPATDLAPHASGKLPLNLPPDWRNAGALYLAAYAPGGEHLWTWDWQWKKPETSFSFTGKKVSLKTEENDDNLLITAGSIRLSFDRNNGKLQSVTSGNQLLSFSGPYFIAARRGDRSKDMYYNHDDKEARSKERVYFDVSGTDKLTGFTYRTTSDSVVVEASYFGDLTDTRWVISSDGGVRLDYGYQYNGAVELMGLRFDYPEEKMLSKRWLGKGPYRVWQNRLHGVELGIWENEYNDPVPGESFIYPEFKGYFAAWQWVTLKTTEGAFSLGNGTENSYLGVFTPRDGRDALLYTLPESGIAVLKVIPAVRNKVNATDLIGPSSQAQWVNGLQKGSIYFQF
jgi:beta-galactosidase/beta-glucuronidase